MKSIQFVLLLAGMVAAQYNYSGYRDTVAVSGFQSNGTGVTRAFELSRYEDLRVFALANDSSEAGYASDSIHFHWGIETGDIVINTSGKRDTTWLTRFVVDTFDILTAANLVEPYKVISNAGAVTKTTLFIDTVNVTGWAVQDRLPFGSLTDVWAPIFRFWYAGLGSNITGSYVVLVFGQSRRLNSLVHIQ